MQATTQYVLASDTAIDKLCYRIALTRIAHQSAIEASFRSSLDASRHLKQIAGWLEICIGKLLVICRAPSLGQYKRPQAALVADISPHSLPTSGYRTSHLHSTSTVCCSARPRLYQAHPKQSPTSNGTASRPSFSPMAAVRPKNNESQISTPS